MSLSRPLTWLAAVLSVLTLVSTASAQKANPFIELDYFEPDFQFFAPAEVSDFGLGEPANTGFFFTYDRVYFNMSRPEGEASIFSPFEGDWTWGNRYDFGYMTDTETGWYGSMTHLNGPSASQKFRVERLNRINGNDDDMNPDPIIQDRNPREYNLTSSLNEAMFTSIELNKTWRRKTFHNGGTLEPIVGFRFMNFKDIYRRDQYSNLIINPLDPNLIDGQERFDLRQAWFENQMLGGQLGFRYFNQRGHWMLATEVKFFAMNNFQILKNKTLTINSFDAEDDNPSYEERQVFEAWANADEFVWGGELRGEASYELTRDVSFRVGFVFMDIARGLGRGNTLATNDQDVQWGGVTFGLTVNR